MSGIDEEVEKLHRQCLDVATSAGGVPHMLEALWDGDTQGWGLCLFLTAKPSGGFLKRLVAEGNSRHEVTFLRYGSDMRLFNNQVPPWPETVVARRVAKLLEKEHGCTLWFPSPDQPDDDNPAYADRHRAVACTDCRKLFIPSDSPHLPKNVCYHCHLAREERERLRREPGDRTSQRGIYFQLDSDKPVEGFSSFFCSGDGGPLALLKEHLDRASEIGDLFQDQTIALPVVEKLATQCRADLTQALEDYEPVDDDFRRKFSMPVSWEGRELLLDVQFEPSHKRLADLIGLTCSLEAAAGAACAIQIYTNVGIKYRDTRLLSWLKHSAPESKRSDALAHWKPQFGSEKAVEESLARLGTAGCLQGSGEALAVTAKGRVLDLSEEGG